MSGPSGFHCVAYKLQPLYNQRYKYKHIDKSYQSAKPLLMISHYNDAFVLSRSRRLSRGYFQCEANPVAQVVPAAGQAATCLYFD
jgi:hypothetical protein